MKTRAAIEKRPLYSDVTHLPVAQQAQVQLVPHMLGADDVAIPRGKGMRARTCAGGCFGCAPPPPC